MPAATCLQHLISLAGKSSADRRLGLEKKRKHQRLKCDKCFQSHSLCSDRSEIVLQITFSHQFDSDHNLKENTLEWFCTTTQKSECKH